MKVNPNYLRYVWVYFRPEHKGSCHKKDCHIGLTLFTGERESGPIGWTNDTNGPFLEMAPLLGFYKTLEKLKLDYCEVKKLF